jgi:hypothetical protein
VKRLVGANTSAGSSSAGGCALRLRSEERAARRSPETLACAPGRNTDARWRRAAQCCLGIVLSPATGGAASDSDQPTRREGHARLVRLSRLREGAFVYRRCCCRVLIVVPAPLRGYIDRRCQLHFWCAILMPGRARQRCYSNRFRYTTPSPLVLPRPPRRRRIIRIKMLAPSVGE